MPGELHYPFRCTERLQIRKHRVVHVRACTCRSRMMSCTEQVVVVHQTTFWKVWPRYAQAQLSHGILSRTPEHSDSIIYTHGTIARMSSTLRYRNSTFLQVAPDAALFSGARDERVVPVVLPLN